MKKDLNNITQISPPHKSVQAVFLWGQDTPCGGPALYRPHEWGGSVEVAESQREGDYATNKVRLLVPRSLWKGGAESRSAQTSVAEAPATRQALAIPGQAVTYTEGSPSGVVTYDETIRRILVSALRESPNKPLQATVACGPFHPQTKTPGAFGNASEGSCAAGD